MAVEPRTGSQEDIYQEPSPGVFALIMYEKF